MRTFMVMLAVLVVGLSGCRSSTALPSDARTAAADAQCRAKWGKGLSDLPATELIVIGANNESILDEYRWAFSLHHAVEYGQRVNVTVRDAGGGGSSVESYLFNVYGSGGSPEIDVIWGGGEFTFIKLAKGLPGPGPLLEPLKLSDDVLANVPEEFGGSRMIDAQRRWIGSAVSGFGFLYNAGMLQRCRIAPPQQWDDLADPRFAGLLELADPTQSAAAASCYRMIAMSAPTWPQGWAKLLNVLANARSFADTSGGAANSPVLGEALLATCIDFYGATRVAEAPNELAYVSPRGQTVFSPDPIGVLKGAPHPEIAQRFVQFVLSRQGQALWALPPGTPDGPVRRPLGRQPIRRDVYQAYAGKMLPYLVDPYAPGVALQLTPERAKVNFTVLRELVAAAAVNNRAELSRAWAVLQRTGGVEKTVLQAEFYALPPNVATVDQMNALAGELKDKKRYDQLARGWRDFFAAKYAAILDRAGAQRTAGAAP